LPNRHAFACSRASQLIHHTVCVVMMMDSILTASGKQTETTAFWVTFGGQSAPLTHLLDFVFT
jgi:hypothetical protein